MSALGISAGLCYLLSVVAFGGWLIGPRSYSNMNGDLTLFGAGVLFLIAATFIHGLRAKLDDLIAVLQPRPAVAPPTPALEFPDDTPPAKAERDAAWLIGQKPKA